MNALPLEIYRRFYKNAKIFSRDRPLREEMGTDPGEST